MNVAVNILTTHPEISLKQYLEQYPDYLLAPRKAYGIASLRATEERHFSRQTSYQLN